MRSMFRHSPHSAFKEFSLLGTASDFRMNSFFGDDDFVNDFKSSRMEVVDNEHNYDIRIEAPGLHASDISIQLADGVLTMQGKKNTKETREDENGKIVYSERRSQSFHRQVTLPENADESKITASQKDGIVNVSIKKKENSRPRTINIPVLNGNDNANEPKKMES